MYLFEMYDDFKIYFNAQLLRVKSGEEKHAPSVESFERVSRLIQAVKENDFKSTVLIHRINRYLKEFALLALFVNDELTSDILLDALHGNLAHICWQLGIAENDDETKAALQFVLDETGKEGAQL